MHIYEISDVFQKLFFRVVYRVDFTELITAFFTDKSGDSKNVVKVGRTHI